MGTASLGDLHINVGDLHINEQIILNWIKKEQSFRPWTAFMWLKIMPQYILRILMYLQVPLNVGNFLINRKNTKL